jgi:uncharacterized protein
MQLSQIHMYPVKSCAGIALQSAEVQPRGLAFDRRWMLAHVGTGKFLTARDTPKLLSLHTQPSDAGILLTAPDLPEIFAAMPSASAELTEVSIWDDSLAARVCNSGVNQALSAWLNEPVQLVFMGDENARLTDPRYATEAGQSVSFADGFPLLLIAQASLDGLNERLSAKGRSQIPMARFRPNLVVTGAEIAHAEDGWRNLRIGQRHFAVVKPCVRCVLTTIDTTSLTRDPFGEPLKTLIEYRRGDKGVTFGMNLIPLNTGLIRVGDGVEVLG